MTLTTVIVRKPDGRTQKVTVCYGGFVGHVFPDGDIVEQVLEDDRWWEK